MAQRKKLSKKTAVKKAQKTQSAKKSKAPPVKSAKNSSEKLSVTKVSFIAVRDGVLVERVQEESKTAGGLIIPTTALEKSTKGWVVSAGKGKFNKKGKLRPLGVQKGDQVMFDKFAGTEVKVDGKDFLLLREDEILGVVS